jgi:outer membrane protein assembly factor BamD
MNLKVISILFLAISISSCSNFKNEEKMLTIEQLEKKAYEELRAERYKSAATEFAKIYYQYPGTNAAIKSEVMEAYSLYKAENYYDAIDVLDAFIKNHPINENIQYAYYLKGLCYYYLTPDAKKDINPPKLAKENFEYLNARYKNNIYSKDIEEKMKFLVDKLMYRELMVANYYALHSNPIASIARLNYILNYPYESRYKSEAKYKLVEAYMNLQLYKEAKTLAEEFYLQSKDDKFAINSIYLISNVKLGK